MGRTFIVAFQYKTRCPSRGVLSSTHYKRYNNPLLLQLEDKYTGTVTGSVRIPHITVSDDLAVLSNSRNEMQHMLDDTGEFANMERYIIHPTKSGVLTYSNEKNLRAVTVLQCLERR